MVRQTGRVLVLTGRLKASSPHFSQQIPHSCLVRTAQILHDRLTLNLE